MAFQVKLPSGYDGASVSLMHVGQTLVSGRSLQCTWTVL
uniref:Uncharacterized protein n=1 Tax=Rhizophora mucronata TaxID=61149 RepID=A0A2P2PIL3_RHIMU